VIRSALALPLVLLLAGSTCGCSHALVHLKQEGQRTATAVLILPGALYDAESYRAIRDWFTQQDFDVYVPDYESRDGLAGCVANLAAFVEEHSLGDYEELHVLTYVLGGWTLNLFLGEHNLDNITHIVYVRGPIEERMARVVADNMPRMAALARGSTPQDMNETPYPPIEKGDRRIGLLIESRAVPYMRRHKEEVLALGELEWAPESFGQDHDDYMYLWLDHYGMYRNFDQIGPELLHFYRHGRFSAEARRVPFEGDPFGE
jgi:hypothetical protein